MRKHLLIILLGTVLTFGFIGQAAASYSLPWLWVQHRVYEDGRDLNRLGFWMIDDNGDYPPIDIVDTVTLYDPNGNPVPLSNLRFSSGLILYGDYYGDTGQWVYHQPFIFESGNYAEIDAPLIVGTYHLEVLDIYGDTHENDYDFNGIVNLPTFKSRTFRVKQIFGYLLWEWKIPLAVYDLAFNYETSVRAIIEIYNNDQYVGTGYFKVPTHMEKILIPPDVIQDIFSRGDRFDFILQLRTNDSNNRSYSNPYTLP